ncbi:acyltransferase family protein [Nonomuraea sp. NPDC050663]|uniref:acyltransferase family protein n=1 Tax=Nonomuraea sp. NPDC050663 TaxID=3364370 RepID=UPI0037B2C7AE
MQVQLDTRSSTRLNGIDGLRVLAALGVLVFHVAGVVGLQYGTGALAWLMARGEARVAIFFAISGLLLYQPWAKSLLAEGGGPPSSRIFLTRRLLRIFPLYWLVAVTCLVAYNLPRIQDAWDWVNVLLLIHFFDPTPWWPGAQLGPIGLQQMWTLAVDLSFYLLLPLLAWALGRLARRGGVSPDTRAIRVLVMLGLLSLASFGYLLVVYFPNYTMQLEWILPRYFPWFAVGMAICVVRVWARSGTPMAERVARGCAEVARNAAICFVLAALLFGLAATELGGPKVPVGWPEIQHGAFRLLAYTLMTLLIIAPVAFQPPGPTRVNRFLGNRTMTWLSNLSYGLFAWHILGIYLYYDITGRPYLDQAFFPVFLTVLAGSLAAAWVTYHLIERPGRILGKRIERAWGRS